MLDKQLKDLKDYARADYAREIFANKDKPLEERWRLAVNSEEHQRRQLFGRTRAKYLGLTLLPILVIAVVLDHLYGLDAEVHLTIGSYDVGDAVAILVGSVYVIAAFAFAWRVGNKVAQRKWDARRDKRG